MTLSQAMRYPFQGQGWFQRVLTLAIVQLIPVIGQIILVGYGIEVVRAIYAEQKDLPPIRWSKAARDGLRFLIAGLLYATPLMGVVPTILSVGVGSNMLVLLLSIGFAMIVAPLIRRLPIQGKVGKGLVSGLVFIVPMAAIVATFTNLVASPESPLTRGVTINGIGVIVLIVLSVAIFLITIGLCVGGVRYAVEGKGLFDPTGNVRLLLKHKTKSAALVLNLFVLSLLTLVVTATGIIFFVLPGLYAFVIGVMAGWYLLASFGKEVAI